MLGFTGTVLRVGQASKARASLVGGFRLSNLGYSFEVILRIYYLSQLQHYIILKFFNSFFRLIRKWPIGLHTIPLQSAYSNQSLKIVLFNTKGCSPD